MGGRGAMDGPGCATSGAGGEDAGTGGQAPSAARRGMLVLGLGNPILGDDAIGWRVADEVARRLASASTDSGVEVDRMSVGGLTLMERLVGVERAVLVDAIAADALVDDPLAPGEVRAMSLAELGTRGPMDLDSAHDAPLAVALDLAVRLGAHVPSRLDVVVVAIEPPDRFSEDLSPPVAAAVGPAARAVLALIGDPA